MEKVESPKLDWLKRCTELEDKHFRAASVVVTTIVGLSAGGILTLFREHRHLSSAFLIPMVLGLIQLHIQHLGNITQLEAIEAALERHPLATHKHEASMKLSRGALMLSGLTLSSFILLVIAALFKIGLWLVATAVLFVAAGYIRWIMHVLREGRIGE